MEADSLGLKPSVDFFSWLFQKHCSKHTEDMLTTKSTYSNTSLYHLCICLKTNAAQRAAVEGQHKTLQAASATMEFSVSMKNDMLHMCFWLSMPDGPLQELLQWCWQHDLCMPKGPQVRFSQWHSTQSVFSFLSQCNCNRLSTTSCQRQVCEKYHSLPVLFVLATSLAEFVPHHALVRAFAAQHLLGIFHEYQYKSKNLKAQFIIFGV